MEGIAWISAIGRVTGMEGGKLITDPWHQDYD